jgi:hypothetical protein
VVKCTQAIDEYLHKCGVDRIRMRQICRSRMALKDFAERSASGRRFAARRMHDHMQVR